ncbi:hypothetical protein OH76DRAFT_1407498 [Lentinus brumalis]|uniref:F-box domain-containing protein n=1 Tax=Lentinus brumalis TaxID=2498619 RepID=A0A371D054_9APHY|nr:hypothetical protein OH76DRAFT_1407498 [Polyporus brumalis]
MVNPSTVAPIDLHEDIHWGDFGQVTDDHEHTGTFAALLAKDPPSVTRLPFLLPRIVAVRFKARKMDYFLWCHDSQGRPVVTLTLTTDADVAVHMDALAPHGARDLAQLLAGAPAVKSLTVCTDFDIDGLRSEDIRGMLTTFPALEEFHLEGCSLDNHLIHLWALFTPTSKPGEEVDILCPKLKTLTVKNGDFAWYGGDDFFDNILPMLRERDACGSRLDSLDLELMEGAVDEEGEDSEEEASKKEYERLKAKYLPELEKLVTEVTYNYLDYVEYDWERDMDI